MSLSSRVRGMEGALGYSFRDYQLHCFTEAEQMLNGQDTERMCLYYKTGSGKTITSLATMKVWGREKVLVITVPSTYDTWLAQADLLGMEIECISHAKFRMAGTKVDRFTAIIADEMHMFGSHKGKGWRKLDRLAQGLKAPLILASATPSYNDADRVYCVQHILQPQVVKGGFLQFLYDNCFTEANHFATEPDVVGFRNFPDAETYLASLPGVMYVPDDLVYTIQDTPAQEKIPQEFEEFGYDRRRHKMIASQMEERHQRVFISLVKPDEHVEDDVFKFVLEKIAAAEESVLIYANHSTVADALSKSLRARSYHHGLITGKTSPKAKQQILDSFRSGKFSILIGTASLGTGTDGLDKVADTLIIVDDTDDDSARRQLIGRIMPRDGGSSSAGKHVHRLVLQ